MPSKRQQFNVRMNDETAAKVERLLPIVSGKLGVELSQSQFLVRWPSQPWKRSTIPRKPAALIDWPAAGRRQRGPKDQPTRKASGKKGSQATR